LKARSNIFAHVDWLLFVLYTSLVAFGWVNIYAADYDPGHPSRLFDFSRSAGKQLLWITATLVLFFVSSFIETRVYRSLSYTLYGFSILLLLSTFFWGVGVGGHRAWFYFGGQPSELAKLTCAMAVAKYADESYSQLARIKTQFILFSLVLLPMAIVLLQGDLGSSLVFVAFAVVFYREGLFPRLFLLGVAIVTVLFLTLLVPHTYLVIGILSLALILIGLVQKTIKNIIQVVLLTLGTLTLVEGVNLLVDKVLKPHQQNRIKALVDPTIDPLGIGQTSHFT